MPCHVTGARRVHHPAPMHPPSRKRMRLSSPTFDEQVGELSQDDINAFDSLDAQLSRYFADPRHPVQEDENPFYSGSIPRTERIHAAFTSVSAIDAPTNAPSDEEDGAPPEIDYVAWFNSDSSDSPVGFSTAATAMLGFQRPSTNGEKAPSLFIPSAAALQEAEEKMRKWQEDVDSLGQVPTPNEPKSLLSTQVVSPRVTFSSARTAFQAPETPIPTPLCTSASTNADPTAGPHSVLQKLGSKRQTKPFRSPLISTTPCLLPHRQTSIPSVGSPSRDHHSSTIIHQTTAFMSPLHPSSVVNHAMTPKPLGFTPIHKGVATRPKFVTPFKAGVKSGTSRRSTLENTVLPTTFSNPRTAVNRIYPPSAPSPQPTKQNSDGRIFNLTPPPDRYTLASSGLRPQVYSAKQLKDMGIDHEVLSQVNLRTAPFYAFTCRSRFSPNPSDPSSPLVLGRLAILEELHAKGCIHSKQVWVDNHWPLVLWKLAGMVVLDPTSESDPCRKRWCWPEVVRQFMYRYERDLNSSSRPPLRLITARDASPESPMVLCVSDVIFHDGNSRDNTASTQTYPELEVTDGWYRLRAHIDAPLARAVRKGKIKTGRKIAIAGAKLSAERREGSEVLEAYSSNVLLLTGNSTHMAPWHAKLGFQRDPFVATLNSLTADGGNVAVMMLTVTKAHPIAYIEFLEDTDGRKQREGPHDANEELKLSTQWKTKRESHASRLWSEYEKRRDRLLDYTERLEQRVGSEFRPKRDDGPPDKIYDVYDTLREDAEAAKSIVLSLGCEDAGWLARHIREKAVQDRDDVSKEIERELESICPPRDVRAFCVVVVSDTRTYKYPAKREAQITVWDVLGMSVPEGCSQNPFVPGQRYLVTNLVPTYPSAWADRSLSGEVYLSTRKNSKWTLIS